MTAGDQFKIWPESTEFKQGESIELFVLTKGADGTWDKVGNPQWAIDGKAAVLDLHPGTKYTMLKAVAPGTATITAQWQGQTLTKTITVVAAPDLTALTLDMNPPFYG